MIRPIFLADYTYRTLTAQRALGSPNPIFTAVRGVNNPAIFFDENGVMQKTEDPNSHRWNYGYWNTTGWHKWSDGLPGLLIEGGATNYLKNTYGAADTAGLWDNWQSSWGTTTVVDATNLIAITGATAQRIVYVFGGAEADWSSAFKHSTSNDSFDASGGNINVTISFWAKGDISGITTGTGVTQFVKIDGQKNDNTYTESICTITLANISLSATEWRRFSFTGTLTNVNTRKVLLYFMQLQNSNKPGVGENFDIQITGVQLEKLPFASSFIPTVATALTRNAETLKYRTEGNRSASVESCVVKVAPIREGALSAVAVAYITTTDTKDRNFYFVASSNDVTARPNDTDSPNCWCTFVDTNWAANAEMTLGYAMQHASPYVAGFYNGTADGTNETADDFTNPAWGTYFYVGCNNVSTNQLYGTIFSIAFFDRILTADEMKWFYDKDWRYAYKHRKVILSQ